MRGAFDIKCDIGIVNAGGFFCNACLVGKPLSKQSEEDARYCKQCQQFMDSWKSQDSESPKSSDTSSSNIAQNALKGSQGLQKGVTKPTKCPTKSPSTKEVMLQPETTQDKAFQSGEHKSGGRPKKDVPVDLIHKLSKQGLSIRGVGNELKAQGITISLMTISRVLSGRRG